MTKPTVMMRALASAHLPSDIKLFLFGFLQKSFQADDRNKIR